jgi:hypothetical protein
MKKISLLFVVVLLSACGATELEDPERGGSADDSTVGLTFVSGHFGSYWDCPEDAFQAQSNERRDAAPPQGEPGVVAGDCADDTDCGGFLNCSSAQLTLQIENTGEAEIRGIHVREIQVLDQDGEVAATLPVLTVDTVEMDGFQGRLGAGTTATLRIDFQGPQQLREILGDGTDRAPVRVIIEVDEQKPAGIETPELEALGQIAT